MEKFFLIKSIFSKNGRNSKFNRDYIKRMCAHNSIEKKERTIKIQIKKGSKKIEKEKGNVKVQTDKG